MSSGAAKKGRKMIVRCRKCWVDVAVQFESEPLKKCPRCFKKETYFHAYYVHHRKPKNTERLEISEE